MKIGKLKIEFQYGDISVASLLIAAVSGMLLAINYNVNSPYLSVSEIVLLNPFSNIIRNIHYWSAQLFLISLALHVYEHLKKKSEADVGAGVWLRLSISVAVTFYVMLSGFILKGDADSLQAFRILQTLLESIPLAGKPLSLLFLGNESNFQTLYIQHIASGTIFLFIITFEHSRRIWTTYKVISLIGAAILAAGIFINAPLHDNISALLKGPWYFAGLQEILYRSGNPAFVLLFSALLFAAFSSIPLLYKWKKEIWVKRFKIILLALTLVYLSLTVFAFFFRGENWELILPWNSRGVSEININSNFIKDSISNKQIDAVLGRHEGCIYCHDNVRGLSLSHDVKTIGCQSCHGGNPFTLNKTSAHEKMYLIPGNLSDADRSCGTANCHPDISGRVQKSIMNTMSGVVSVDRYVFGESDNLSEISDIKKVEHTPADKHLRNLCASCHIGKEKTETGEITEQSRGGGCLACHLNYSDSSKLEAVSKEKKLHRFHPDLNIDIGSNHCFGCHSRSGRISTNYEGWFETDLKQEDVKNMNGYRVLMDGRVFEKKEADVHFDKGMTCIDCHLSLEIMGDGNIYAHKENQVKINCVECHPPENFLYAGGEKIDAESGKILALRKFENGNGKFLLSNGADRIFTNTFYDSVSKNPMLVTKSSRGILPLKKMLPVCFEGNSHKRLYCGSCHTRRVSQCVSCHTEYKNNSSGYDLLDDRDVDWEWVEHPGEIFNDAPPLGVRFFVSEKGDTTGIIETFIPGMVLSLDGALSGSVFKRLFSPIRPHNTVRESRTCKSCHNNPVTLGYGRGELVFKINGQKGIWSFYPEKSISREDGLPRDAWIGFMKTRQKDFSTRENARPFNVEEQIKILTAGACLTCHDENSMVMKAALLDFEKVKKQMSGKCAMPVFQ